MIFSHIWNLATKNGISCEKILPRKFGSWASVRIKNSLKLCFISLIISEAESKRLWAKRTSILSYLKIFNRRCRYSFSSLSEDIESFAVNKRFCWNKTHKQRRPKENISAFWAVAYVNLRGCNSGAYHGSERGILIRSFPDPRVEKPKSATFAI